MRLNMGLGAAAALGVALLASNAMAAGTAYLAPGDNTNQIGFSGNPGVNGGGAYGVGNTITLTSAGKLGSVDLFGYAGGGSLPIELDLYAGSDPNSGTLLGSAQVTPTGNGYTTEIFNFGALAVPQTLTYIVSIVGNSGSYDDSFVDWQQFTGAAGAPTIGTSGDMWFGSPGSYVVDNSFATSTGAKTDTLGVQFNAVPEPSLWAMLVLGVGMIGAGIRGSRRRRGEVAAA